MRAIDELALARWARETLATAEGGTLHIDGVDTLAPERPLSGLARLAGAEVLGEPTSEVLFYEDGGRPTFLCAPDSAVSAVAAHRRLAVLSVPARRDDRAGDMHAVILAGRLTVVGEEDVSGESVSIIGLEVGSVVVEQLDPDGPGVIPRSLALTAWAAAAPDPLAEAATRIVEHTNRSHIGEVRAFVTALASIDQTLVLSAELAELDGSGFVLDWIDNQGGHRLRVRFPTAAHCPATLAARLRETLSG